jgi:Bacterial PH domain
LTFRGFLARSGLLVASVEQDPSVECRNSGTFDRDSEFDLWFSGLGKVRLEFKGSINIQHISQLIGHVL